MFYPVDQISISNYATKRYNPINNIDENGDVVNFVAAGGLARLTMGRALVVTATVGAETSIGQSVANDIIDKRPVSIKKALIYGAFEQLLTL